MKWIFPIPAPKISGGTDFVRNTLKKLIGWRSMFIILIIPMKFLTSLVRGDMNDSS